MPWAKYADKPRPETELLVLTRHGEARHDHLMGHDGPDLLDLAEEPAEPAKEPTPVPVATPPVADTRDAEIARISRSKRRAAWALFAGALLFLSANFVVQLIQCTRRGTGVGLGDGMPAGNGRAQTLVPQATAGYNEAHTADTVLHEVGLMLVWFLACGLVVWGYYALLSRLRAV